MTSFRKKVSIKKQFFIFAVLSLVFSLIVSAVSLGLIQKACDPLYSIVNVQNFMEENKRFVLFESKSFKDKMDMKFLTEFVSENDKDINYWIVGNDGEVLYSYSSKRTKDKIPMERRYYSKKVTDKATGVTYRLISKPLIIDGELEGVFVLKLRNSAVFDIGILYKLIQKSSDNSLINLLIFAPGIVIPPVIVILFFSLLFYSSINNPLEEIILWSEKIKNNDLNFKVDSSYSNELSKVMEAFENMRAALENSLKKQWIMTEQRKDMILSLTHDIKTPITVICGHLELITENYPNIDEAAKESSLNIIMNNALRVKRLVYELNEVWDLEKIDFKLNRKDINVVEFLEELKDSFSYIFSEKGISFSIAHALNTNECFLFDGFRVKEVLENLISNALRYTPEGGKVTIECAKLDKELVFKVMDSGKGFSEKHITDIFERFYSAQSIDNQRDNCGLGLYICKLIVQRHNGNIKAYNSSEGGAVVEFSLKSN